jgi:hypothetical protein
MNLEGPQLEVLTRRLTETPTEFLAEPRVGTLGAVHVDAVVADLLRSLGGRPSAADLKSFTGTDARRDRNRLSTTLLLTWLMADEWFRGAKLSADDVLEVLFGVGCELGAETTSQNFVTDAERREEMVRLMLARLGFRPSGETLAQAQDRLTSLSASERKRFIAAAKAAEERARAIREALARQAAKESADKYTRE